MQQQTAATAALNGGAARAARPLWPALPAWAAVALALLALAVWFGNIGARDLVKSDEGRYAEIAREMVAGGDWVTPRLNGIKYFEKPPLQYWATAAFYRAFGIHEWTARLWNALTGLATVLFTGYFARRLFGREIGIAAGLILGSSALFVGLSHFVTLDVGLACFMTLALGSFLLAQRDGATAQENRRWMLAAWLAAALGVLSKGLVALAVPAAVLVLYSLWQRDAAPWTRLHFGPGLLLFAAVAAPWFVAVSLANPEFPRFFFWHEHVERFLTRVHGRYAPWWFFLPVLAGGLLPWTLLAPRALAAGLQRDPAGRFQPARLLWLWVVFVFVFFSLSSSKLTGYVTPLLPALAVLLALALRDAAPRELRWTLAPVAIGALGIAAATPWLGRLGTARIPAELFVAYAPWVAASMVALASGLLLGLWLDSGGRRGAAVIVVAGAGLLSAQGVLTGHDSLAPTQSAAQLARRIGPWLAPDIPFYSVNFYDHTLNFYIRRTVTLVEIQDEMAFGIAQEPERFVPDLAAFAARWRADGRALAITSREYFPRVQATGLPLVVLAEDTRRVVFRKP